VNIRVDQIKANPNQPRRDLGDLGSLAASIKAEGVLQPVLVEGPMPDGFYWLVDGERRWRAAMLAELEEIPALVRTAVVRSNGAGSRERLLLAVVANMQRKQMDPLEEALAFRQLAENGFTVSEIAEQVGMHVSSVYSRLRLLSLEPEIQELYAKGMLPMTSAAIQAIETLPADKRVRIASSLAYRGATAKTIKAVCKRVSDGHGRGRQGRKPGRYQSGMQWDAMQEADVKVEPWIELAAIWTCKRCALYEDASPQVCKECPLVDMLRKLSEGRR
jgi:ParB family chromosome partitioning protein